VDHDRTSRKQVLFVDDEPEVIDGLRDALRRYRRDWDMRFVTGGVEALAALSALPADVMVTDVQMPGMDGAELLTRVQALHPSTIRLVLSGYANTQLVARAATVAHRILAKPCNVEELALMVQRSCALHELTKHTELFRIAAATTTLPSRPGLYMQITQAVADPRSGPDDIARIIERDAAMTAKLLQIANSAFFGIGRTVTRVRDAVVYLGADTIKALTLSAEAFTKLAPREIDGLSIDALQRHSTLVARLAAAMLPDGPIQQDAVTAALVHDIGHLILISDDAARWRGLVAQARRRGVPLHAIEQEELGTSHAAVGAYLLSLWGLPDGVVEAVANHHQPSAVPGPALDAVAVVHIADALAHEVQPELSPGQEPALLDEELLDRLAIRDELPHWRELARAAGSADR
jgi:HD-like signal output (HDOD) protein/ActR/RegA family two-component response regulator